MEGCFTFIFAMAFPFPAKGEKGPLRELNEPFPPTREDAATFMHMATPKT
jgi:hypothetical protein